MKINPLMMSKTTTHRVSFLTLASSLALAHASHGQHFAMPDDPDLVGGMMAGEPCESIPRATTSFGSATQDGWVYVMGGYTGRPHDYHREGQSSAFYRINLYDLSRIEMLKNEQGMQSCPLESWNGKIIRTGGLVAENAPGEPEHLVSLKTVHAFDTETMTWSPLPDMPSGRSSHDTAIIGDTLFVFGGWNLDANNDSSDWYSDIWMLDLANPESGWTSKDVPFERRALASVAIDGKIIVIGGMTSERGPTDKVVLYDPASDTWVDGPEFPSQAFGVAADNAQGTVIASAADGAVYAWAPTDREWTEIGAFTFPRFFHQMAADHNGDVLAIGGISRGMRPSAIERLPITTIDTENAIVKHWQIPTPSDAKNRQAFFMRDGWVYMFGGNNSTGQHDFEEENFLAEGYKMNLATMTWRKCSEYPMPRQSIQTMMSDDMTTGFALGGFGYGDDAAHTHVEGCTYDFKTDSWNVSGPHLPVSRSQFGLAQNGEEYWVFGGLDYDPRREEGDQFRHLEEVMMADTGEGDETFRDSGITLPNTRRAFGGVTVGDKYYMIGGMTDDFELVPPCDVFDFNTRAWSEIAPPERTRLSPEAVVIDGNIFIAGGMSPKADGSGIEPNKSLEMYDTETGEWSMVVEELPFALRHITMMPYRGQLLVFSSHESPSNMAHVVLINPFKVMPDRMQLSQIGN
jgi:N-acetylneuraminic acid mutarotase